MVVKYRIRLYIFTVMLLVGFGALAQRLWNLSVERNEEFVHKIPTTKEWRARAPGTRGEIKDRNGITLVANKPSFEVRIDLKTLVDEYRKQLVEENKGRPPELQRKMPMRDFLFPLRNIMRSKEEIDIVAIFDEVIIGSLNQLGLSEAYSANNLRVHYRTHRGVVPWAYRSDLPFEEFAKFAEHRLGLPGVHIEARPVRQYLYDSMACHVLGYVAGADVEKVSEQEIKEWDSYVPDDYGVAGLEKSFDDDLRGRPGIRTWLQNEKGRLVSEISYQEPRKGNDVYLTIDARIQMLAEKALRESTPAIGRGAVVVLDPSTGEVLAMASVPSFNPNKFIPAISRADLQAYNNNLCNPLLNRSVRSYVPGSTYKIMTSFAGIIAGVQKDVWNCPGGLTFGNRYMKCWIAGRGSHGSLGLSDAIKQSCNCFFYKFGNHAGDANLTKAGDLLGLGTRTGIELEEEDPGILPTRRWWSVNRPREPYSDSTIANISIGQGAVQASPLQMAGVASAVASGGLAYKPHLLKKVMDGNELVREQKPDLRANFADFGLTPEKIELVRKGMWRVVMEDGGTARSARINNVEVAGKTGTAQNWRQNSRGETVKDNHTLFITFAPYVNPKFACCILVQGGKGGGVSAAPIAKRIMEQALALETGYEVALAPVPEVEGNFNPVEVVSFDGMPPVLLPGSNEEEAGDSGDNEPPPRRPQRAEQNVRVRAAVRPEADEEGSRNVRNQQTTPRRANIFKRIFGR